MAGSVVRSRTSSSDSKSSTNSTDPLRTIEKLRQSNTKPPSAPVMYTNESSYASPFMSTARYMARTSALRTFEGSKTDFLVTATVHLASDGSLDEVETVMEPMISMTSPNRVSYEYSSFI